ncbi:MAG TPA: LD-carboxypeptidase, partial [Bdellovibrionota bacterium]|nr:LD-carboxypeptidase [Bdellovibrionota bacterium]
AKNLLSRQDRYLAGSDRERAAELHKYFEDKRIKGVFCIRGGYGSSRIIPLLKKKSFQQHPKIFLGYSDITSLHLFFNQHCHFVTIYGPHPFELSDVSEIEKTLFQQMVTTLDPIGELSFDQILPLSRGKARGRLVGGCLTLVASSLGTPYEIDTTGKILFLEDYDEAPYKVDRMLTQLKNAGKFKKVKGIIFGGMVNCDDVEYHYTWQEVVKSVLADYSFPIMTEFPAGHGDGKISLPLGTRIEMNTERKSVIFLEAATKE